MSKSKQVITPKDIAQSLDKISAWVRGVRSAVLKMDKKATITIPKRGGTPAAAPVPMIDGCPPAMSVKTKKKK
jgi:hypothetical protein